MAGRTSSSIPVISVEEARRMLLGGQGLLGDPFKKATPAGVHRLIERMGFVQVDTINIVERAHHQILYTRLHGYEERMLTKLLEQDRKLFEHWTHDASVIPRKWLGMWKVRFKKYTGKVVFQRTWWAERMGDEPDKVIAHVMERITEEGPLMSRDFEHAERNGPWWGWKPQKAALEYLWRIGKLTICARRNFHKVYDLTERVFEDVDALAAPGAEAHVEWACGEALQRLGCATPAELSGYLNAVDQKAATGWAKEAVADGRAVEAVVESADGSKPRRAVARTDWRAQVKRLGAAPAMMRLLSPFDPVIRDRKRLLRLFDFDYRFEAFTPAAKRTYGYYVMPLLEGEALVGRLDAKLHRKEGRLEVRGQWWEDGVKATKARKKKLAAALDAYAGHLGAREWELQI